MSLPEIISIQFLSILVHRTLPSFIKDFVYPGLPLQPCQMSYLYFQNSFVLCFLIKSVFVSASTIPSELDSESWKQPFPR